MRKLALIAALVHFVGGANAQAVPLASSFTEEFSDSTLHHFFYGTTGTRDAFKCQVGAPSTVDPSTRVLAFRIDPADSAGPGRGPEIISSEFTHFGSYSARIKIPNVRGIQPNVGAVVGYFTYYMDSIRGLSEIDIEWLLADPTIIYIGTWTGYQGKLQRIGRTIDLAKGVVYNTIAKVGYTGVPTNLTGLQNVPTSVPAIPGFDASSRFYEYGFDWHPDRLTWWIADPTTGRRTTLWDYTGSSLGIPQNTSRYRMNFWHTNNWAVETNAKAIEKPLHPYEVEVDWMKYMPAQSEQ